MATNSVGASLSNEEISELWTLFKKNQSTQNKLELPEFARTVMKNGSKGALSVISGDAKTEGFPSLSIVDYVADEDGKPIFSVTEMAGHFRYMRKDSRISLMVTERADFNSIFPRVSMTGLVEEQTDDVARLREVFLKKLPDAFYVDFGDFHWFKMTDVVKVDFTTELRIGTGRSGSMDGSSYLEATPDPVAQFSPHVAKHMNESHQQDNRALAEATAGFEVEKAEILRVDKYGIDLGCTHSGLNFFICRASFLSPATTRTEVRQRIVEITIEAHEKTGAKYKQEQA